MKLYCVRHGEALAAPDDSARPLSERGHADVTKMARHLHHCAVKPGHIMHSPRVRAVQTAETFASILGVSHLTECANGLDGIDPIGFIAEQLPHWHDDTMLVGHLPFMSKLVSGLVMHDENHAMVNFATGAVVCLDQYENGRWIVNWLLRPSMICDVAGNHPELMF